MDYLPLFRTLDRRNSSSLTRSSSNRLSGDRFVTNAINQAATEMFSLDSFQQNPNLVGSSLWNNDENARPRNQHWLH